MIKKTILSFYYALQGIKFLITTERNAKIQVFISLVIVIMGFWLKLLLNEWLIIILSIATVLAAETFNTAIEQLCNYIEPQQNPKIKIIKDLSAGAVLILSFGAAIIGIIIFFSKLVSFFN